MHYLTAPLWLSLAVVLFLLAVPSFGQDFTAFTGRVTAVSDGDSMTVVDGSKKAHRVRLAGIDAPELGQEFGRAARRYLSDLILDQTVTVVGRRSDGEGRLVAQVFLLGRDISYSMLWAGFAWHDKELEQDQPKEDRKRYAEGENSPAVRETIFGLYPNPFPHGSSGKTIPHRKKPKKRWY